MLEKIIGYFVKRHLLANFIVLAILLGGIFAWQRTSKEELPDITFDMVRIYVRYPGAPAEDVEYFVTKPIEEAVRGLDGVHRVRSTSSVGQSDISVELEQNCPDIDGTITEIRSSVLDVNLPQEVIDDPSVRVFKTSKKAILDIVLIDKNIHLLDVKSRGKLQEYALALEGQLLNLPEVNSISKKGYLQKEIQVKAYPRKLLKYKIPFNTVMREIQNNHVRKPAGTIEAQNEPKVTLLSELDSPDKLRNLIVQGGFEGQVVRLGEVADIVRGYEKTKTVSKTNGHEGIVYSVVKNSSYGILETLKAVNKVVKNFKANNLENTSIELVVLDDESIDIRNRLSLIAMNGTIGFILILAFLFIFLDIRSGIWVAMGIPFTLCFTMLFSSLLGYTINGTTLAAVIIVMGMIVDDAIVVAENITRLAHKGMKHEEAIIKGASAVFLAIIASIVTTCIAFVPLFFFEGHFGKFVEHIPPIILLMLGASLFESIFILPGHMGLSIPCLAGLSGKIKKKPKAKNNGHWFEQVENKYGSSLEKILPFKWIVFSGFIVLLVLSGLIAANRFKFVMFPNEETRDIVLMGRTAPGTSRYETAKSTKNIENIISEYLGREVVGYRTEIARSRRGGSAEENYFRMIIETLPKEKRKKSADEIIEELKQKINKLKGFKKITFQKSRWGHSSGSPIELVVQQNNDEARNEIVERLVKDMEASPFLTGIEVDEGLWVPEYRVSIDQEKTKRLSIDPVDVASTFRAALEGKVLYEFSSGDEDVQVRFTMIDEAKNDIDKVLDLPVENKGNYLVPLRDIVSVEKISVPGSIARRNLKRTTIIDADISKDTKKTPIEIAEYLEENVFPGILSQYPTTTLSFDGEVSDTRESKGDLTQAIIMAILLIYIVLALLFNSLIKPFIIMLAIPFGVVGIILAFWLHGKTLFGFYAAIGALGLAGVVINDSIIMVVKLDKEYDNNKGQAGVNKQIAHIAKTRLRAVILTTLTTVAGMLPAAYGFAGYDSMLAEMMLALTWGLVFGTLITLLLVPCAYSLGKDMKYKFVLTGKMHLKNT
ncbi:MAG: efflux RND transporter permease subunit [Candidatus Omnitrophica bacterium]|nr:efflux RND transporter permease subunit [Candidatus Omnitrophota bacterium]